jgi:hypothetical protein
MSDNPARNMKSEKFCLQLSTKIHAGFKEQEDFQTVLRAAGETETMQENIQDWLELGEGDPKFQLLTEEEIAVVIFYLFSSALPILLKFAFVCFQRFFCRLGISSSLIRIIA